MHPTPPPSSPWAPGPPQGPPSRRRNPRVWLIVAGAAIVLVVLGGLAVALTPDDEPSATASPAASSAPTTLAATPRPVPTPTAAQQRTYLAMIARIDPGLVVNRERAMRRAGRICERIIQPPGGALTLERYTVLELSGGYAQINEAQARQVIKAVKVWCRG